MPLRAMKEMSNAAIGVTGDDRLTVLLVEVEVLPSTLAGTLLDEAGYPGGQVDGGVLSR